MGPHFLIFGANLHLGNHTFLLISISVGMCPSAIEFTNMSEKVGLGSGTGSGNWNHYEEEPENGCCRGWMGFEVSSEAFSRVLQKGGIDDAGVHE